jgi:Ion channel
MEMIAGVLIVCMLLKTVSIVNAIRWLSRRGEDYRLGITAKRVELAKRGKTLTAEHHMLIAEETEGDFFPFGYKDMRLRHTQSRLVLLFHGILGRLERLTAVSALFAVVGLLLAMSHPSLLVISRSTYVWLLYTLLIGLLVCALLIAIEASYSYATLKGYAEPFHMKKPRAETDGARLLLELRFIVFAAIVTAIAATAGVFVVSVGLHGFDGIPQVTAGNADQVAVALDRLLDSLYFVISTFATVGYGDIHAADAAARALVVILETCFFLLVGLSLLTLTLASRGEPDADGS